MRKCKLPFVLKYRQLLFTDAASYRAGVIYRITKIYLGTINNNNCELDTATIMKQILLIVALLSVGDAGNILGLFSYPSESHNILGSILLGNLARRGHNVTYISPFKTKAIYANFTHLVVDDILKFRKEHLQKNMQDVTTYLGNINRFRSISGFASFFFESSEIQWLLKSDSKFDLMIHFGGIDASLALAHHFDVPVIVFSPVGGVSFTDSFFGNPVPVAYVPSAFLPFSDDMNFFQRLMNALLKVLMATVLPTITSGANKAIQKYLPACPLIEELQNRIQMVFINSHISTETPRPYLPAMVQIGGYHLQEPEPLPEDLKKIIDDATNGVVYFSFGTNIKLSDIPKDKLNILIRSLGKLPLKVLVKFDKDILDNKPDNIEIRTWFPQRGVLSHPNVKLFISHGGYSSCTESLFYGVSKICIPFTVDQPKNCADVERHGYGIQMPLNKLTTESFGEALKKVLHDEKFLSKAKLMSELYRDQEMNPMDRAAYWVNHVIKHKGAKHLRAKVLDLAWYQYYLIDVIAFLVSTLLVVMAMIYCLLKFCLNRICRLQLKIKIS